MKMKDWQQVMHKAFSAARPRGVRFQFFTDFVSATPGMARIELWLQTNEAVKDAQEDTVEGLPWRGFVDAEVPHDITDEGALSKVKALFAKFGA